MRNYLWPVLLLLLPASCGRNPLDARGDRVSVRLEPTRIVALNRSNTTYYYALVNPRALITWTICVEPATCPRLAPGDSATHRIDELLGGPAQPTPADVALYYWRLVADGTGGYRPDHLRQVHP